MSIESIVEEYLKLALAIDVHEPGYVDAYFGPAEWRQQVQRGGKQALGLLSERAEALGEAVAAVEIDAQRRDFLARQVHAMVTSLRLMGGEEMSLADETEGIYDIRPAWTDESAFEEAHRQLGELLPPGGSLLDRVAKRKGDLIISAEKAGELLPMISDRLRELTRTRYPLPEDEAIEFEFVQDKPWGGYNWYLGGRRSRIQLNTDLPIGITRLVLTVAHEAYPGHHTELCIKDSTILRGRGWQEHCIVILNSPSCVLAEGIATSSISAMLTEAELREWYVNEIMPRAGLDPALGENAPALDSALQGLGKASDNAAFMMHERGANDEELVNYLQRYELMTEPEARKRVQFIRSARSYTFTYRMGKQLLDALFERKGEKIRWFTRLLSEAVTPSQVREWIGE